MKNKEKIIGRGLTFDDVLLVPAESSVLPRDASVRTRLTKKIELNAPLLSAAMDTVTESAMAVAIAREGGLGVIHRNLSIEEQAREVARVKKAEAGVITQPITLAPQDPVSKAFELAHEHGVAGFPVVDNGKLVGILTKRDWRLCKNLDTRVEKLMTKKVITAPASVSLEEAKRLMHEHRIEKLPLVAGAGNKLAGLMTFRDIDKMSQYPNACKDKEGKLRVAAAVGVHDLKRVEALVRAGVDAVIIDTAHGHSRGVIESVREVKKHFDVALLAGNVVTREATRALISAGADGVKVGVGPGATCTARVVAGVGVPQLTAVLDCSDEAGDIPIVADGGVRYSGDIAKALAAGASSVMLGALFAGTDEAPPRVVFVGGRKFKAYRGMGSVSAMMKGSKSRYFQDHVNEREKLVPEGIEGMVPFKGSVREVVYQLVGGLKSAMGYCGCATIEELRKRARFIEITGAGLAESHPHDLMITDEAPNYPLK